MSTGRGGGALSKLVAEIIALVVEEWARKQRNAAGRLGVARAALGASEVRRGPSGRELRIGTDSVVVASYSQLA